MGDMGLANVQKFDGTEKTKKERSPSFPFISLPRAIERLTSFEQNHKRNATRIAVAAQTWGYQPKSSGLLQTIAAMKAYGLLEDVGGNDERKVQLTESANRLLRDSRPGVRDREIRDSALKPRLFKEYAEKWCSDRPSDNHRISELHLDRGFTAEAARTFIKVFDETLSYARLDKTGEDTPGQSDNSLMDDAVGIDSQDSKPLTRLPHYQEGLEKADTPLISHTDRATFPLPEGLVQLEVPTQLSQASYDDLAAWVDVMLRRIKRSVPNT